MDLVQASLVQFGAVGVIAVLALTVSRMLFNRWTAEREEELRRISDDRDRERLRGDRLESELGRLNETVRNDYLTTITRASQAMADANRAVADALAAVRRS